MGCQNIFNAPSLFIDTIRYLSQDHKIDFNRIPRHEYSKLRRKGEFKYFISLVS